MSMDAQVGAEEAAMIEQESGMGSSGGETGNGTSSSEDSSTFWSSSSNSDSSSNDLSGKLHRYNLIFKHELRVAYD